MTVSAELLFQTIGYRWAENLRDYDAFETNRFVEYYEESAEDRHARFGPTQCNFGQQWCWKRKIEDMAFHAVKSSN